MYKQLFIQNLSELQYGSTTLDSLVTALREMNLVCSNVLEPIFKSTQPLAFHHLQYARPLYSPSVPRPRTRAVVLRHHRHAVRQL